MSAPSKTRRIEPVALSSESTIVAEFEPDQKRQTAYQSEAELESTFIEQLQAQGYERLPIHSEAELKANLRRQIEKLNQCQFSDAEWQRFFDSSIGRQNDGIIEKTERIQTDHVQILERDDGTTRNIRLIDKDCIHNNTLQVINQYEAKGARKNRYDVTMLVNGLPMVHVELKRRGVSIREAFNQIRRYQRDSFWAGTGLFEHVHLFVISNGTHTKYYSNTVRDSHVRGGQGGRRSRVRPAHSFSFTSWWADAKNNSIPDLTGFTKTFFAKHSLLNVLTKYCVFNTKKELLVMRPYQICATEQIVQRINTSTNHKQLGSIDAGGYIWHTTGSGKTLTSFKVAQLAMGLPDVDRVLFVVDRKDLDDQTMREYDRFEKGCANSNASTAELKRQLENKNSRIVITTIQKLSRFVAMNPKHPVYGEHVVLIFDECHRSQFGAMHGSIAKQFKRYHLFGFTGTPIFVGNAGSHGDPLRRTTEQAFGERLHLYTVVDAINDGNVLPFRIDYIDTIKLAPEIEDSKVRAINTKGAMLHEERIRMVVDYIRKHFDQKTKRATSYQHGDKRLLGFNSLFATDSIAAAKLYYREFAKQEAKVRADRQLKIALIYSSAPNENLEDESFDTESLDKSSLDSLGCAIRDYNKLFNTNFDTTPERFQNYYTDVAGRLRSRDLDLVIVVNMLLTGFDATTLNTLWLDKPLRDHGLIQAYSRTNRILNSVKTYGNVVSFRNLDKETNDSLALFGNKDAKGIVLLKPYKVYYGEYRKLVASLKKDLPVPQTPKGKDAQKKFINQFGAILRIRNILCAFDEFSDDGLLSERELQDYQSVYLDLYNERQVEKTADQEAVIDDLEFEIELVKQVDIDVDYILKLVEKYLKAKGDKDKEIRAAISRAVAASPTLRSKKDLIEAFVAAVSSARDVAAKWADFIAREKAEELDRIIVEEHLDAEKARRFVENAFRDEYVPVSGTAIIGFMPPVSRFSGGNGHAEKKQRVTNRIMEHFERFCGLG